MSHPAGPPDLFLDRSLGRITVPRLLRDAGLKLLTLSSLSHRQRCITQAQCQRTGHTSPTASGGTPSGWPETSAEVAHRQALRTGLVNWAANRGSL